MLTEATLRYRLCAPEVMLGQLARLISFAALPKSTQAWAAATTLRFRVTEDPDRYLLVVYDSNILM